MEGKLKHKNRHESLRSDDNFKKTNLKEEKKKKLDLCL